MIKSSSSSRARGWRRRRESDSQAFCHPIHCMRWRLSTKTFVIHPVRTTTTITITITTTTTLRGHFGSRLLQNRVLLLTMAERFNLLSSGSENEGSSSESCAALAATGEYIAPAVSHVAPASVVDFFGPAVSNVAFAPVVGYVAPSVSYVTPALVARIELNTHRLCVPRSPRTSPGQPAQRVQPCPKAR